MDVQEEEHKFNEFMYRLRNGEECTVYTFLLTEVNYKILLAQYILSKANEELQHEMPPSSIESIAFTRARLLPLAKARILYEEKQKASGNAGVYTELEKLHRSDLRLTRKLESRNSKLRPNELDKVMKNSEGTLVKKPNIWHSTTSKLAEVEAFESRNAH